MDKMADKLPDDQILVKKKRSVSQCCGQRESQDRKTDSFFVLSSCVFLWGIFISSLAVHLLTVQIAIDP